MDRCGSTSKCIYLTTIDKIPNGALDNKFRICGYAAGGLQIKLHQGWIFSAFTSGY